MDCVEITSTLGCWAKADETTETVAIVREYRKATNGETVLYKTRYARPDGSLVTLAAGEVVTAGECSVVAEPLVAPGALLSANICVGSPIYAPQGNADDVRTVGTGGEFATFAAAMADASVVNGTILRAVSDVVDTTTVNVDRAVVIDTAGFTASNTTAVTMFNVTAADAVITGGTLHHTKTTNTSLETVVSVNVPSGVAYVYGNTIKVQEFGLQLQGGFKVYDNVFEYAGASQTNSHRFIAIYKITAESRIDNNKYVCSTIPATTRYSNFVFMGAIAGSAWTAPLYVTRNEQTGGSLRQFVFNEALVPAAGSQLIVAANTFNDFNGGIGLISPALYNGLDKIVIVDNDQGAAALGNFKGVFFVDGTGTMDDDTVFIYGGNTTTAGPLRADYLSFASDTDNIVARKNTVVPPTEPSVQQAVDDALEDTGLLLQDLKGRRTHIVDSDGNPVQGYGTEGIPFVLPEITSTPITTSLVPKVYQGTGFVSAQANDAANSADALQMSDGTLISAERIKYPAHPYTVGNWYYLSQTTAGAVTDVRPTTGLVQQLFFVEDANTLLVNVEPATESVQTEYANVVRVNATNPNSATIFDLEIPPATNDDDLKADAANLYVGTDGSVWVWNGTSYSTKETPASTEWFLAGTTTDAGSNKTGRIYRTGGVTVGSSNNQPRGRFVSYENFGGSYASNVSASAQGVAQGQLAGYSFYTTFQNTPVDNGPRRSADIWSGFNGGNWGKEFLAFGVGTGNGMANDSGSVTTERMRIDANGNVGFATILPLSGVDVTSSFGANTRIVTADTTTNETDFTLVVTVANVTVTLRSPVGVNRRIYVIKNWANSVVSVAGLIDGTVSRTIKIGAKGSLVFQSDNSTWNIIASHQGEYAVSQQASTGAILEGTRSYFLADGNYTSPLTLPANAPHVGFQLTIINQATLATTINTTNTDLVANFSLTSGKAKIFQWAGGLKWIALN